MIVTKLNKRHVLVNLGSWVMVKIDVSHSAQIAEIPNSLWLLSLLLVSHIYADKRVISKKHKIICFV